MVMWGQGSRVRRFTTKPERSGKIGYGSFMKHRAREFSHTRARLWPNYEVVREFTGTET